MSRRKQTKPSKQIAIVAACTENDTTDDEDTPAKLHIVQDHASSHSGSPSPTPGVSTEGDCESSFGPDKHLWPEALASKASESADAIVNVEDVLPGDSAQSVTSGTMSTSCRQKKRPRTIEKRIRNSRGKDRITPVVDQGGTKFICPLCNEPQANQSSLTTHIRSHNQTSACMNVCTLCGKALSSQSSLDRHMLVHSGERPFCCKICGMSFTTNGNMHRHMKVHEHDVEGDITELINQEKKRRRKPMRNQLHGQHARRPDEALALPTTISSPTARKQRRQSSSDGSASPGLSPTRNSPAHTLQSNYTPKCDDALTDNEASHGGEPQNSRRESIHSELEPLADTMDDPQDDTALHAREDTEPEHSGEEDQDPDLDASQLLQASPAAAANSTEHPQAPSAIQIPRPGRPGRRSKLGAPLRKCKHCSETFITVNALRVHIRTHMGLSPYRCSVCSYTSVDKSTLVRHLRTHNGQRPFMCRECGFAFTTKANCERHIRTRHHKTSKEDIRALLCFSSVHGEGVDTAISSLDRSATQTFTSPDTVCRFCGKDLHFFRALKKHLRLHMPAKKAGTSAPQPTVEPPTTADTNSDVASPQDDPQTPQKSVAAMPHFSSPLELVQHPSLLEQYKNAITTLAATWQKLLVNTQTSSLGGQNPADDPEESLQPQVDSDAPLDLTTKPKYKPVTETALDLTQTAAKLGRGIKPNRAKPATSSPSASPGACAKDDSGFASVSTSPVASGASRSGDFSAALLEKIAQSLAVNKSAGKDRLNNLNSSAKPVRITGVPDSKAQKQSLSSKASAVGSQQAKMAPDSTESSRGGGCTADLRNSVDNPLEPTHLLNEDDGSVNECNESEEDDENWGADEHSSNQDGATGNTELKKKRNSYSDSPRRIQCPCCTRSFPWISSLKRHLITHTGQKPFRCPRCSLNFSTKSNRERHLLHKHGVYVRRGVSRLKDKVLIGKVDQEASMPEPATNNSDTESLCNDDFDAKSLQLSLASKSGTLEVTELNSMSLSDAAADSLGKKLLENATLIMQPNSKRQDKKTTSQESLQKPANNDLHQVSRRVAAKRNRLMFSMQSGMKSGLPTLIAAAESLGQTSDEETSNAGEVASATSE